MPQRVVGIVTVVAGLLVVAGLVVIGIDVRAAAKRGPRWRRRLLGAGLALLGLVGATQQSCATPTCYEMIAVDPAVTPISQRLALQMCLLDQLTREDKLDPEVVRKALAAAGEAVAEVAKEDVERLSPPDRARAEDLRLKIRMKMECIRARLEGGPRPLADSSEWQTLVAVMDEAETVAGGESGPYPFDEAGQRWLLDELDIAVGFVDGLTRDGYATDAEATLLKDDIEALKSGVLKKRPIEMRMATCYKPMAVEERHPVVSLKGRLPLLEKMAAEKKLDSSVLRKSLASVERDLADPRLMQHPEAAETRAAVKAQIEKLKALAGAAQ